VDSGVAEGGQVSIYYDPMIAKVIATAETRELAIARLIAALREFAIDGIRTNIGFLIQVLETHAFQTGEVDTAFLDREGAAIAEQSTVVSQKSPVISQQSSVASRDEGRAWDPWDGEPARAATRHAAPAARRHTAAAAGRTLTAPMPATVLKIHVKPGDAVKKDDTVLLLEAMKMELPIRAAGDGVVATVRCREGELVQADAVLVEFK
jgi:acetyl/propionyl-CoA carboxylase alpha subunit